MILEDRRRKFIESCSHRWGHPLLLLRSFRAFCGVLSRSFFLLTLLLILPPIFWLLLRVLFRRLSGLFFCLAFSALSYLDFDWVAFRQPLPLNVFVEKSSA